MKVVSFRALALAALASLAMATSSSAVTIMQYNQTNVLAEVKVATVSGGTTTIVGRNPTGANSVAVQYGILAGQQVPSTTPQFGFEVFNLTSTDDAVQTAGGRITQTYNGTITYYLGAIAADVIVLRATFTGATLSGDVGGSGASLDVADPPRDVTFFSENQAIAAQIAANPVLAVGIGFSNLINSADPQAGLRITGTGTNATIAGFTANQAGTFSANPAAVVPEPSGIAMAGMAMVAGLGCLGWRRRQSSQA